MSGHSSFWGNARKYKESRCRADLYREPFHVVTKAVGAACNMSCSYCFYSEKMSFYNNCRLMDDGTLELFVRDYINSNPGNVINFLWQGGEPLIAGIGFYKKALEFEKKYCGAKTITNSIQTNGTLITEEWCRFFRENNFLVGISLDGPADIHNAYRCMKDGGKSHEQVERGIDLLQKYGVDFNVTSCVTDVAAAEPLKVYEYFKSLGIKYIQFAPIVERMPDNDETMLIHASPDSDSRKYAPGTVDALAYGKFLSEIFDKWAKHDMGEVFVMNFEWAIAAWMDLPTGYCVFSDKCGNCLAIEHNGDVFSCDHYVYSDYYLGNLKEKTFSDMLGSKCQADFRNKKKDIPQNCKYCDYFFMCHGECPKNRILPGGENYFCEGYKYYFEHIRPYLAKIERALRSKNFGGHVCKEV